MKHIPDIVVALQENNFDFELHRKQFNLGKEEQKEGFEALGQFFYISSLDTLKNEELSLSDRLDKTFWHPVLSHFPSDKNYFSFCIEYWGTAIKHSHTNSPNTEAYLLSIHYLVKVFLNKLNSTYWAKNITPAKCMKAKNGRKHIHVTI